MTQGGPAATSQGPMLECIQIKKSSRTKSSGLPCRDIHAPCGKRSSGLRPAVGPIFEQIARLTIEHGADPGERIESYASHLAGLEQRKVLLGDADMLSELLRPHLAFGEHHIEIDDYGHRSHNSSVIFGHFGRRLKDMAKRDHIKAEYDPKEIAGEHDKRQFGHRQVNVTGRSQDLESSPSDDQE
jgi:hypothetical protein